jgi:hypothetical protein
MLDIIFMGGVIKKMKELAEKGSGFYWEGGWEAIIV